MERIITKSFARLMGRGTHRGFITHDELSKSLGKRNLSDENLAQAFIHILNENVLIFEVSGSINEDLVLSELKSLYFILSENSHPIGEKIPIKIVTDKSRKQLSIYRDYLRKGKYWLYDEDYKYSRENNIGYIIIED